MSIVLTILSPFSPARNIRFVQEFGNETINIPATIRWQSDGRDSAIWPTEGILQRVFAEVSVPLGDLKYYKLNYEAQYYYPITKTFTLKLNGKLGYGDGYTGQSLPYFKNFFAGGNRTVRGYRVSSLGPRDISFRALGGNKLVVGSAEILFPLPGLKNERSVRLSVFMDAGTVYGPGGLFPSVEGMRYAAGFGVSWISPMGPLKVSIAKALNDDKNDRLQPFQFQFGQQF